MKKPTEAIKSVILWMNNQMYYEHTKWTHGNENDKMWTACSLLWELIWEEEIKMERLTIVRKLKNAADRWEKDNPIIGVGELRICDALREAAYAIEALEAELAAYRNLGTVEELESVVENEI